MSDADFISDNIEIDHDRSDPDDRHEVRALVAELVWDEKQIAGRPDSTGQWLLAFTAGYEVEIDLPHENRQGAEQEARRIISARLADWETHPKS